MDRMLESQQRSNDRFFEYLAETRRLEAEQRERDRQHEERMLPLLLNAQQMPPPFAVPYHQPSWTPQNQQFLQPQFRTASPQQSGGPPSAESTSPVFHNMQPMTTPTSSLRNNGDYFRNRVRNSLQNNFGINEDNNYE